MIMKEEKEYNNKHNDSENSLFQTIYIPTQSFLCY